MSYSHGRSWKCPRDVRDRVMNAYGGCCYLCGLPASQIDHKTAWAFGGSDAEWNLAPICGGCHKVKSEREKHEGYQRKLAMRNPKEDPHP